MREIMIAARTARAFKINRGETLSVVDTEGQQVADLFAVNSHAFDEYFSAGVTVDCKESLAVSTGDILYSNLYRAMLTITGDDVGVHDLLFPACRAEMYRHFYDEVGHSNCFDNINASLAQFSVARFNMIQPLNVFMNTSVTPDKNVFIDPPLSKSGDKITFKAEMNLIVAISACSVTQGACNAGKCKPVLIQIYD